MWLFFEKFWCTVGCAGIVSHLTFQVNCSCAQDITRPASTVPGWRLSARDQRRPPITAISWCLDVCHKKNTYTSLRQEFLGRWTMSLELSACCITWQRYLTCTFQETFEDTLVCVGCIVTVAFLRRVQIFLLTYTSLWSKTEGILWSVPVQEAIAGQLQCIDVLDVTRSLPTHDLNSWTRL